MNKISIRFLSIPVLAVILALALGWPFSPTQAAIPCTWAPGEVQVGDDRGVPLCEQRGGGDAESAPGPQWEKRWGAIAIDEEASRFGGVEGFSSKGQAENAAVSACKKNGGTKKCKSSAYYNQCGALAWGHSMAISFRAPYVDEAIAGALKSCSVEATECKIYYSGCSYPVRVR
jgi:Domain of unknown function (DUF4189)